MDALNPASAVDYVRRTVHVADLKVHSVARSDEYPDAFDVDFDFSPALVGQLDRIDGRMTVWVERDGKLYGEW